jgi:hypothetical protein
MTDTVLYYAFVVVLEERTGHPVKLPFGRPVADMEVASARPGSDHGSSHPARQELWP